MKKSLLVNQAKKGFLYYIAHVKIALYANV